MIDRGQFKYEVLLPWCSQEQTIQVTQRRTLTKDHTKQWHEAFSKPSFHICVNLFVPLVSEKILWKFGITIFWFDSDANSNKQGYLKKSFFIKIAQPTIQER